MMAIVYRGKVRHFATAVGEQLVAALVLHDKEEPEMLRELMHGSFHALTELAAWKEGTNVYVEHVFYFLRSVLIHTGTFALDDKLTMQLNKEHDTISIFDNSPPEEFYDDPGMCGDPDAIQ